MRCLKYITHSSRITKEQLINTARTLNSIQHNLRRQYRLQSIPINSDIPFAKLPLEVHVLIFRLVVRAQNDAVSISQVCQYWRSIALCQPSLWTNIYLPCSRVSALKKILPRSAELPVRLSFGGRLVLDKRQVSLPPDLRKRLVSFVTGSEDCAGLHILDRMTRGTGGFPSLTRVEIILARRHTGRDPVRNISKIALPKLGSMILSSPWGHWLPFSISLGIRPSLHTLKICGLLFSELEEVIAVLRCCPNIRNLELGQMVVDDEVAFLGDSGVIEMAQVERLELDAELGVTEMLLGMVLAPRLRNLRLSGLNNTWNKNGEQLFTQLCDLVSGLYPDLLLP